MPMNLAAKTEDPPVLRLVAEVAEVHETVEPPPSEARAWFVRTAIWQDRLEQLRRSDGPGHCLL